MKPKQIIDANLFPQSQDWEAFIELSQSVHAISQAYFDCANVALDRELKCKQYERWGYYSSPRYKNTLFHDNFHIHLKNFGQGGLQLEFCWNYELQLRFAHSHRLDREKVISLLKQEEYLCIREAFDKVVIPRAFGDVDMYMHRQDFYFGHANDGNWSNEIHQLAWHAGNETEKFVKQCIDKIERFTLNPEVTAAMEKLHREATI